MLNLGDVKRLKLSLKTDPLLSHLKAEMPQILHNEAQS